MAQGIQDIGNNLGYLYKTLPNGTTIVATERNTKDGARSMREQGAANAPIVAQRPAVGTITVTSVAAVGQITAVTIAAVNQISAVPINVTSAVPSVVAGQISAAINNFTPGSGFNYTAQAVDDVVYVFSPVANGAAANGLTISISVTDPSIVTTTTALTNGSSDAGVYDTSLGYRFYIDANYNGAATPTSLVNAVEITEYMTVRGLQTGIITVSKNVASDRLINLNRSCAITQIIVDTEAGLTDVLAYIETTGFAEGDEIRLRNLTPSRVTTVEDAAVSTSPIATKNIYLVDQAPFALTGRLSINLQLRNDSSLGFIWVESGRTEVVNGVISLTISQLNALCVANQLKPNALYNVTDLGDFGTIVTAISVNEISGAGRMTRAVPRKVGGVGYVECWQPTLAAVAIFSRYRYYNRVYRNTTGIVSVGTPPPSDGANWTIEVINNNNYYRRDVHNVTINQDAGVGIITSWPILSESDNLNNVVSQTESYFNSTGVNAYEFFQWQLPIASPITVYNNTVSDSIFDIGNFNCPVYNCILTNGSEFISNDTPVTAVKVANLTTSGSQITSNTIYEVSNVTAESCTFITNQNLYLRDSNFVNTSLSNNVSCDILDCNITDSNISSNINGCAIYEIQGKYNISFNDSTFISNVTGFNDVGGFNQINSNVNTNIIDVTGSLFFINSNQNIIIQYNIVIYNGYISNNNNTVPANKANCRIEQVSLRNEAKIQFNTWNTIGNIVRGSLSGSDGLLSGLLIDTSVTVAVGLVEGVARNVRQVVGGPGAILDQFTLDNVGINGNAITRSLHQLNPPLPPLSISGNVQGISCTPSSNNAFAFIDAATAIAAGVLTIPVYASHAANLYFYNCNGQSITSIVYTGVTYNANYTAGLRLIRMSGAGTLIVTPAAVGVATANQIVADTAGPYTLAAIYDVVEVKKQASFYTLLNSVIVI